MKIAEIVLTLLMKNTKTILTLLKNSKIVLTLIGVMGILVLLVLLCFIPFAVIFALNTLFPVLAIPYTFWTWISVVILNATWMYKPMVQKVKLA